MSAAGGSGTRARTRELGYAEGMREMYGVLRNGAAGLRELELEAAANGEMYKAEVVGAVASWFSQHADYALGAWQLHDDYLGRFARNAENREWLEREGYCPPGPRELPQREHPENS